MVVKPIDDLWGISTYIKHMSGNLQTAALAVPTDELLAVADSLGCVGVSNVKMLGTEFIVDLTETHDGLFDTVQLFMSDALHWMSISFTDTDKAVDEALAKKATCLNELL